MLSFMEETTPLGYFLLVILMVDRLIFSFVICTVLYCMFGCRNRDDEYYYLLLQLFAVSDGATL